MTMSGNQNRLVQVSLNRSRYRTGRWLVVAQGAAYIVLGSVVWRAEALGIALVTAGLITAVASARRRSAVIVTAIGSATGLAMVIVCAVASIHHASGPMGFDPTDILLYGFIGAFSLGLLMWLCPDSIEGKVWRYRSGDPPRDRLRNS